jgi:hypothetical protein
MGDGDVAYTETGQPCVREITQSHLVRKGWTPDQPALHERPARRLQNLCGTSCETCLAPGCGISECAAGGTATYDQEFSWDGSFSVPGSCGSPAQYCYYQNIQFVPPGHYVASMCATRGTFVPRASNGEQARCIDQQPRECVEVPFDFPSAALVEGVLGDAHDR